MKRLAPLLFVIVACGGKIEEGGADPGTSSGTAATPTATTTSVPPSPGDPGAPTPTQPPKDPSPASNKTLTALAQPGGRDHLMIFAADGSTDSCIRIHLAFPTGQTKYPNVAVSEKQWGVESISRSPGAKRCGGGKQPPAAEESTDAKGAITFGPIGLVFPCTVDVHMVALFGGKPTTEAIDGDKISVEGCK